MPELPVESWSVTQAITSRTSQRTYNGHALTPNTRAALEAALRQPPPAPFGNSIRLAVLDTTTAESRVPLGTYGIIRGAKSFLAGAVHRGEHAEEDFGFVLEWAILRATSLGLGTCWLGGTLRRHEFVAAMEIEPGEYIPAVT
ncbi:MAG: nitroreductase, partial [Candidatus Eisenbacteria bacterium]|nr:nitroreductase [Candidatus Eisenbacteria bacterium]